MDGPLVCYGERSIGFFITIVWSPYFVTTHREQREIGLGEKKSIRKILDVKNLQKIENM